MYHLTCKLVREKIYTKNTLKKFSKQTSSISSRTIEVFIEKPLISYEYIYHFSQKHSSIELNYQLTSIFARKYISLCSSPPNFNCLSVYV